MNDSKKINPKKFYLLLGLFLAAVLIFLFLLYVFLRMFLNWFSSLENQVAASVFTISVTALISIGSLILSKHYEHKRDIRKEHNSKKIPIYEEMINFSFKFPFAEKSGETPPTEQETVRFIIQLMPKLTIWADENVIKSFCLFRDTATNVSEKPDPQILFRFEDMLFKIRKDLGHKDKKIKKGDILSLYVNDIKEYLS